MTSLRPQTRFAVHSVFLLVLLLARALPATAQAPLPNPNLPLVSNGVVNAIAAQPDGGLVFGGSFKSVNGVVRTNLARLKPDGTLDADWDPAPNGNVYALAVDAVSGAVYVGGSFNNAGGAARKNIVKLPGSGAATADANWNPAADGSVAALAVGSGGEVYAGGYFKNIGGAARNYIAKLGGVAGAADAAWNPSADATVMALALNAAGDVYAGGSFQNIGALARKRVAKIAAATGAVDPTWDPSAASTVYALAVNAAGDVYAGGQFTQIGGQTRYFIAKLAGGGNGAPDATWQPFAGGYVSALALDAAGNVVAAGGFTNAATTAGPGQPRNYIARFAGSGAGTLDSWNPSMGGIPNAVAVGRNGTVYVGGKFPTVGSLPRLSFAGIDATSGVATAAVDAETNAIINAIARQPNGGLIVAGDFLKAATVSRQYILRLQADGSLDAAWHPSANGVISALATNAAGDVYAGGFFGAFDGVARTYLAKLAGADGTVDATWNPQSNGSVNTLAVDTDGSVYVGGGGFSTIGGQSRNYLAKLAGSGTGAADAAWNPAANNSIYAFALDGAGNLFVGGDFTSIGGQSRNRVAKLTTTGSGAADATWNPSANTSVYALAIDSSGKLLVGGRFSSFGGAAHRSLARAASTGTGAVDAAFGPTIAGDVRTIALDAAGAIFAGGGFFSIAGPTRNALAKFAAADGAIDATWNPAPSATVYALSIAAGGTVYAGGSYTAIGGAARNALAALNGTITYTVTPNVSGGDNGNTIAPNTPQSVNANTATTFAITLAAGYSVAVTDTCGSGGASNGSYDAGNKIYATGPITADCTVNAVFTPIPVNGSCGSANGQTFNALSAASANLCTAGTLQNFAGGGPWTWTCAGSNGGSDATNCSASIASFSVTTTVSGSGGTVSAPAQSPVDYGSATTFVVAALPGYSIAAVGGDHCTPAVRNGSTWSSGTITQACAITATFTADPVDGLCGMANGQTLTAAPSTNLCSIGAPSAVAGNGHPWNWSCSGANGGSNASCAATIKTWTVTPSVAGSGGTISPAVAQTVDHGAALNLTVSPASGYSFAGVSGSCNASVAGNTISIAAVVADCSVIATFSANPVAGACGSADAQTLAAVPSANLCSAGTPSAVAGSGHPWTWTCGGANGGSNATCSATIRTWTVSAGAGTGGSISPTSRSVDHGANTTFAVAVNAGYRVAGVSGCGGSLSGSTYTTGPIESDCSVSANFALIAQSTSTGLSSSPNPSTTAQSVVFTATVSTLAAGSILRAAAPAAAPVGTVSSGTVTIVDAYGSAGAATLCTAAVSAGNATCTASPLAAGSHLVTALYADASGSYQPSQAALTQTVSAPPLAGQAVPAPLGRPALGLGALLLAAFALRRLARS